MASGGSGTGTPACVEARGNTVTLRMGFAVPRELLVERQGVCPKRMNCLARFLQALCRHALGGGEHVIGPVDVGAVGQHRAGGLDLDPQCAERMSQHVVDLAGDAGALVEEVGPALLGLQLLALGKQRCRLLGLDPVGARLRPSSSPASTMAGRPSRVP